MASGAAHPLCNGATTAADSQVSPGPAVSAPHAGMASPPEPILCGHCGRSASNGISCQGMCVADSGY